MQAVDIFKSALRTQGYKITKNRIAILEYLQTTNKPLSAEEILIHIQRDHQNVVKTTIYRELEFLIKIKFVSEVEFGDGKKRYELSLNKPHHHHVICRSCKRVEDIPLESDFESTQDDIEKLTNFKLTGHMLEFFGLCKTCQN